MNYHDFEKFMKNNIHIFNSISEFIDEYHYKPYHYDDYGIYSNIEDTVYLDIDPKYLPINIEDFKYLNYKYELNLSNYIKNKELYNLCFEYLNNKTNKLKNIYDMIISLRK